jgi:hypothetical protein
MSFIIAYTKQDFEKIERLFEKIKKGIEAYSDYNPSLDDPLIMEVAKCIVALEKLEAWLDNVESIEDISSLTDAISKQRRDLFKAMEALAMNRRERLKQKTLGEIKDEIQGWIEELLGIKHKKA